MTTALQTSMDARSADRDLLHSSSQRSFEVFFDRYADEIRGYAACRVGRDIADDVVVEAFAEAWRRRASFDVRYDTARPWLYGIATNVISRHRRREERWFRSAELTGRDQATDFASTIVELDPALAQALGALAPSLRDAILVSSLCELTPTETAEVLGVSPIAIRVRLHRARSILRKHMKGSIHADR